jgi:hypothetical protein
MGWWNFIYTIVQNKLLVERIIVLLFHFFYDQEMIYKGNT